MYDSLVCPNGRVVHIPSVRSFNYGSGRRTNRYKVVSSAASAAAK
jgi:hypothetical protein